MPRFPGSTRHEYLLFLKLEEKQNFFFFLKINQHVSVLWSVGLIRVCAVSMTQFRPTDVQSLSSMCFVYEKNVQNFERVLRVRAPFEVELGHLVWKGLKWYLGFWRLSAQVALDLLRSAPYSLVRLCETTAWATHMNLGGSPAVLNATHNLQLCTSKPGERPDPFDLTLSRVHVWK